MGFLPSTDPRWRRGGSGGNGDRQYGLHRAQSSGAHQGHDQRLHPQSGDGHRQRKGPARHAQEANQNRGKRRLFRGLRGANYGSRTRTKETKESHRFSLSVACSGSAQFASCDRRKMSCVTSCTPKICMLFHLCSE